MYCGICIEVCPFDALFWSPEFEYAETDIRDLTHERDKLREWMWTVPAPPALDPGAEEPKEIATARKTAEKLAAQQAPPVTEPHADEQARAAEGPTRAQGDSQQQTDQPRPSSPSASRPMSPPSDRPAAGDRSQPDPSASARPGTEPQPKQEGQE
jgi:NADH-quinone oxidoreductase subunit I